MLRRNTTTSYVLGPVLITVFIVANYGLGFAWGPQGHKVIAYIAELNLSPEAKKYIARDFNINNLADVAIWADIIRKKRKNEIKDKTNHLEKIKIKEMKTKKSVKKEKNKENKRIKELENLKKMGIIKSSEFEKLKKDLMK